ncbi:MAG TPA: hypothetical protein VFS82_00150 [Lysobacter sp.]|nr:hypothetical protein [Lysobacter sp.]
MIIELPDDDWLREQAGPGAYQRGSGYCRDGRIVLQQVTPSGFTAEALGTYTYRLRLSRDGDPWRWQCDCPAAANGAFCKHLVAAVMTASGVEVDADAPARNDAADSTDGLRAFLQAQPAERLADWLWALAQDDHEVEKRLLLYRAANEPGAFKAALAKVLSTGGDLDWRRTLDYAARLDPAIDQLREFLRRDPAECRPLCEYALKRLLKVVERCDDSAGALGDRMAELADLHAQACAAAPPGKPLAATLLALQRLDDWNLLPLAEYWAPLGSAGQADYTKRVLAEFENLPPPRAGHYDYENSRVCRRVEALARCANDFDLLQRALRRDLSDPWQHLRVLESLREFGRAREALAWAETAIKRFPTDDRLLAALAECLGEAGMDDEALEHTWQRFLRQPIPECWRALKRWSGDAWPAWRDRALEAAAKIDNGHASLRIRLLMDDGDLESAVELARNHPVRPDELLALASRLKRGDPASAGAFYLRVARLQADNLRGVSDYPRLAKHLAEASALLPESEWRPLLATIRETHRRKTRLMGLLDKAAL